MNHDESIWTCLYAPCMFLVVIVGHIDSHGALGIPCTVPEVNVGRWAPPLALLRKNMHFIKESRIAEMCSLVRDFVFTIHPLPVKNIKNLQNSNKTFEGARRPVEFGWVRIYPNR